MFYINQQDYPNIPYPTNMKDPQSSSALKGTVASSGCGLCSMMMVVDHLTTQTFSLEEAISYAKELKANMNVGTNMKIFGSACAERFGLSMTTSDDTKDVEECLKKGGCVIVNVGGDHDDHVGTFSDVGHYVIIISFNGEEFCVMDPAYRVDKYTIPGRKGKVREDGLFLYTTAKVLMEDTANRTPGFYLFQRKSNV